jgi:preprotein translocase subunit SecF
LDFVGKRNWFFLLSLLVIAPGIVFLISAPGLRLGIDFTGGSSMTLEFQADFDQQALRDELGRLGHPDAIVQKMADRTFFVRTKELQDEAKDEVVDGLELGLSPDGVLVLSFDLVSPVVGAETVRNAFVAVLMAAVGVFLFVWWAFRTVPSPFRYGAAAIVALLHDAAVVIGVFAILGVLFDIEVNTMFLIALLTVIGYSVNDTIVVFDRLRENVTLYPNRTLEANANLSISETLGRSLNTSLTLAFTLMALLLFGGPTIRNFLWVLLIGVVSGTYSSLAIATPFLVVWESGTFRRFFGRLRPASPSRSA